MHFLCIPLVVMGLAALFSIPVASVRPEWFRMAITAGHFLQATAPFQHAAFIY